MTDTTPILAIILCGVTLLALALLLLWRRDTRRAAAERTEAETRERDAAARLAAAEARQIGRAHV